MRMLDAGRTDKMLVQKLTKMEQILDGSAVRWALMFSVFKAELQAVFEF